MKKVLATTKFYRFFLNLKTFALVNLLRKSDWRKLLPWKIFETYYLLQYTNLLSSIFGIIKPLLFAFFNHGILTLSAIYRINAFKKFKNYQFSQNNFPKISFFWLVKVCENWFPCRRAVKGLLFTKLFILWIKYETLYMNFLTRVSSNENWYPKCLAIFTS